MKKILVLHGPNLNLLGKREPHLYGNTTLKELDQQLLHSAVDMGYELRSYQSNSEAELINEIHNATENRINYVIFNPAAFTHTSIALRDALVAVNIPFIEVHLTNIYGRETFRQHSYFSDIALGVISGFGHHGYLFALKSIQAMA